MYIDFHQSLLLALKQPARVYAYTFDISASQKHISTFCGQAKLRTRASVAKNNFVNQLLSFFLYMRICTIFVHADLHTSKCWSWPQKQHAYARVKSCNLMPECAWHLIQQTCSGMKNLQRPGLQSFVCVSKPKAMDTNHGDRKQVSGHAPVCVQSCNQKSLDLPRTSHRTQDIGIDRWVHHGTERNAWRICSQKAR